MSQITYQYVEWTIDDRELECNSYDREFLLLQQLFMDIQR
jgi:hypothetical protein